MGNIAVYNDNEKAIYKYDSLGKHLIAKDFHSSLGNGTVFMINGSVYFSGVYSYRVPDTDLIKMKLKEG